MVSIPRADLEALQAELRRLRRAQGDRTAAARLAAGTDRDAQTFTRTELAEAWGISD